MRIHHWNIALVCALGVVALGASKGAIKNWNFDGGPVGALSAEFEARSGEWKVVADESAPSKPNVIGQTGKSSDKDANLLLLKDVVGTNIDIQFKFKTVGGEIDQGCGVVFRAKDEKNYYLFRYNPLESNIRVYKVLDGERIAIHSVEDVFEQAGWQAMRIVTNGKRLEGHLYGEARFSFTDETFGEPGRVGLWTRADAQTYFDDLQVEVTR